LNGAHPTLVESMIELPESTERIVFRSWRAEDEHLAITLWGDERVTAFIGGKLDAKKRLESEMALERDHGVQYWPVFLESGEHVGCCGLRPKAREVLELGFHLRSEHWGKGFALEASRSVLVHAFDRLGASWLFAGHHPDNDASKKTLLRLGFHYTHDELYPPTGLMHHCYRLDRAER
jgi:ribosomal-protein-alanine N-acetyltransferase